MNFIDVLNAATTELSDNKLSKKLGVSRTSVSGWRNYGHVPHDAVLDKLAELSGLPIEKVYFAAYADKIKQGLSGNKANCAHSSKGRVKAVFL